jgi:hypothetical protein
MLIRLNFVTVPYLMTFNIGQRLVSVLYSHHSGVCNADDTLRLKRFAVFVCFSCFVLFHQKAYVLYFDSNSLT